MTKKILLVDDDTDICEIVKDQLEQVGGYMDEVECAMTLESGIAAFEADYPELVILDWLLSGHTGKEFLEHLNSSGLRQATKVLLLCASPRFFKEARDLGVDATMGKPFEMDDLLKTVKSLIGVSSESGKIAAIGA